MSLISISFGSSSPPTSPHMTIITGLVVALVAGIVLFFLNWFREWITGHLQKRRRAEMLAFSLTTQLDELISGCMDVAFDSLQEDYETGEYCSTVTPPSITFKDDIDWTVFPRDTQFRVRSLPNQIDAARRSVAHEFEYGEGPPYFGDAFLEREYRFSLIGLEAIALNDQMAAEYKVPKLDRGAWAPRTSFEVKIANVERIRAEAAELKNKRDWFKKRITIEELAERHADFHAALDAATNEHRQKVHGLRR
ncbi:hypothetical protein CN233_18575 [Sinorhizobium meliloti]|uniref:hypothetical protein n=1 Tax=Rhizobium meliloti TaxID=382 RepID=UPI000FDA8608|nr:hypothetical protein [Sinorhizobium meliloti]RVG29481.1 hypothetical protein CN233_18575 [Sinorhizobium meliloti]